MQIERSTEVARVDRDYLWREGDELPTRSDGNVRWTVEEVFKHTDVDEDWLSQFKIDAPNNRTRFRLKDDDGEIYYGGWLYNDDECAVQEIILEWGKWDAGCVIIEVKIENEWTQEIG